MLFICPTPIGNLEDITLRTLKVLENVDEIYAEDTNNTIKLLNHYKIKKPLFSLHKFNETKKSSEIIEKLKSSKNIAYVSDAGMPGISDPGEILVKNALENNIEVTTLPGASAFVVALVNSGLSTRYFTFIGFLNRNNSKRKKELEELKTRKETLIFYESPLRVKKTLEEMLNILGNRKVVIAREISKKFEEYIRNDIESILAFFRSKEKEIKGEVILIVDGNENSKYLKSEEELTDDEIINNLKELLEQGISKKNAVKLVSKQFNINKNKVYDLSLKC